MKNPFSSSLVYGKNILLTIFFSFLIRNIEITSICDDVEHKILNSPWKSRLCSVIEYSASGKLCQFWDSSNWQSRHESSCWTYRCIRYRLCNHLGVKKNWHLLNARTNKYDPLSMLLLILSDLWSSDIDCLCFLFFHFLKARSQLIKSSKEKKNVFTHKINSKRKKNFFSLSK